MPILVLLDTSLSMNQNPLNSNKVTFYNEHQISRLDLAKHLLNNLMNNISLNNKLESIGLVLFSRTCQVISKFTRNYDFLKNSIQNISTLDKTNLTEALSKARDLICEEKGHDFTYHVLIITDGNALLQSSFLNKNINSYYDNETNELDINNLPLPLPFKSKIHIVCMTTVNDPIFQKSAQFYKEIILKNCGVKPVEVNVPNEGGQIWVPDVPTLSYNAIEDLATKICHDYFKPYIGKIICGNLSSSVTLFPNLNLNRPPSKISRNIDKIQVYGFLNVEEIASPPVHSRHLVLPLSESLEDFKKWMSFINLKSDLSDDELTSMFSDESKQPSFGVLLHGSLKVANMVALCKIGSTNWYGLLYSGTDNKKKSNLMLATFEHGPNPIPWFPPFQQLTLSNSEPNETNNQNKKSSNYVVWLQQSGIQSDVQKIMRYARKLPEKYDVLISEINRIRRSAIAFNFYDLIDIIIKLLERESRLLPSTAHPDAITHINQIIKYLKQTTTSDTAIKTT